MPDVEIREQRYRDERSPEHFARYHERTRAGEPEARVYEVVRALTVLNALISFRARSIGSANVPAGPVILAPNHASFMDHFFLAGFVRRRVQFMAKSQLFAPGPPQYI
ncbi:MAG: lysophospholipid acyltransferase family protein, partial [Solirubrobacteraceae bacterium]